MSFTYPDVLRVTSQTEVLSEPIEIFLAILAERLRGRGGGGLL